MFVCNKISELSVTCHVVCPCIEPCTLTSPTAKWIFWFAFRATCLVVFPANVEKKPNSGWNMCCVYRMHTIWHFKRCYFTRSSILFGVCPLLPYYFRVYLVYKHDHKVRSLCVHTESHTIRKFAVFIFNIRQKQYCSPQRLILYGFWPNNPGLTTSVCWKKKTQLSYWFPTTDSRETPARISNGHPSHW